MHNIQTSFIRNNHHFYSSGADYSRLFWRPHISLCSDDFFIISTIQKKSKVPCFLLYSLVQKLLHPKYGLGDVAEHLAGYRKAPIFNFLTLNWAFPLSRLRMHWYMTKYDFQTWLSKISKDTLEHKHQSLKKYLSDLPAKKVRKGLFYSLNWIFVH